MSYVSEYDLMTDVTNDLHKKTARAIDKSARDVINEDPGRTNHANRKTWATWIRQTQDNMNSEAHRWIVQVLDNPTIASAGNNALDSDVQYVVEGLVDTMANDFVSR